MLSLPKFNGHYKTTVEPLNNGQSGATEIVLYKEVSFIQRYYGGTATSVLYREVTFIQRSFNTQSTMVGQQQVSFTERCPLFRVSIIRRFHCKLTVYLKVITRINYKCSVYPMVITRINYTDLCIAY